MSKVAKYICLVFILLSFNQLSFADSYPLKNGVQQLVFSNLLVLKDTDNQHLTIIDTKLSKVIYRYKSPYPLSQEPISSPDKQYVYLFSRKGWIGKFNLGTLNIEKDIYLQKELSKLTLSSDGRYLITAETQPSSLRILSTTNLETLKLIPVKGMKDNSTALVKSVFSIQDASARSSFVIAFNGIDEFWEILYADDSLPVYNGLMHDYKMGEGLAKQPSYLPIRKINLNDCLRKCFDSLNFYPSKGLMFISKNKNLQVIQFDARRKIAELKLQDELNLGSSIFLAQGALNQTEYPLLAVPNTNESVITFIDIKKLSVIKRLETSGVSDQLISHKNSDYIWAKVTTTRNGADDFGKEIIQIIDKQNLKIIKTLDSFKNKQIHNLEFSCQGRCVIARLGKNAEEIVILDSNTFKQIQHY